MTMYCIRVFCSLILLLYYGSLLGQDNFTGYFEPDISLNYKVATNYSHNFKISQRSYVYEDDFRFRGRQLDVSHFSNLKIRLNQSIALGLQYRFRNAFENDRENELRITQQYNITFKKGIVRWGNRFRSEQRITPSMTTYRFRYRLVLDLPLNGEELDVGESYFIASTESLLSAARRNRPEYDQRITAQIGWLLNKETKLQAGAEYRAESYNLGTENVVFLLSSLVFSL